jgi:hypothetical protein
VRILKKAGIAAAATVLGTVGTLAAGTSAAYAGDIGDPVATGCINHVTHISTAALIDRYNDLLGYVQNYYSAYCDANWGRVYTNGGYTAYLTIVACQNDGGGCSLPNPYVRVDSAAYSDMVVGTHVVCATGSITVDINGYVLSAEIGSCQ